MTRLTTEEIEAIRERIEGIWFDKAYVKGDPWKGYEVRCETTGQTIAETSAEIDAEFIAEARTDIPALLAEVERLGSKLDKLCALYNEQGTSLTHRSFEVYKLRKALEFYAYGRYEIGANDDGGFIAEQVLKATVTYGGV